MKKTKVFNSGDKVFAKVKGYPPWPAKVRTERIQVNPGYIYKTIFSRLFRRTGSDTMFNFTELEKRTYYLLGLLLEYVRNNIRLSNISPTKK